MEDRKKIEEKLRKKEHEIEALEERLKAARVYVQALQDVLRILDQVSDGGPPPAVLKPGSAVAQARDVILSRGEPVHISALLEAMGKDASRETRASLTSSLAAYVRRSEIFTRPAPNTFGLVELGHTTDERLETEPPAGFGRISNPEGPSTAIAQPRAPKPPIDDEEDIPF
ncbi:MAG TPA: hypothetical protein VIF61_04760 [Methylocystis sp.]|jgi:hypothetical protein